MKKDRILVVEDDDNLREAICDFLDFNDLDHIAAANGKDALSLLDKEQIDLMVCDINLPDILGTEILQHVRNHSTLYRIPFIFLSAFADKKDVSLGMNLGADDYITKPFAQKTLIETINARLKKARLDNLHINKEVSSKVLSTISENLSHEIITPLNGIINGAYFINSVPETTKVSDMKDAFLSMYSASLRMKRDIQNMILASAIETQKDVIVESDDLLGKIQVDDEINTILEQYRSINPQLEMERDIEATTMNGSLKYMRIIFTELIDNAVKFHSGKQPITIRLATTNEGFEFTIINTITTGLPFTSEELGLFKKFHTDETRNGLGLGLYISKMLCHLFSISFNLEKKNNTIKITLRSKSGL